MLFSQNHRRFFGATRGAYSKVTFDERKKGQITITESDGEAQIVVDLLGADQIPRERTGEKRSRVIIRKTDNTLNPATLSINFPKKRGNELRVYRNDEDGFGYEEGDIWFVYERNARLHVGAIPEPEWRNLLRPAQESDDVEFQTAVENGDSNAFRSLINLKRYSRNPALTGQALASAGYRCEFASGAMLFTSARTGRNFLEGHHLIPLYATEDFNNVSLDFVENIVALSPWWHRAIHHGKPEMVRVILEKLYQERAQALQAHGFGISFQQLASYYACEEIVASS